jgi:hypothetical protein
MRGFRALLLVSFVFAARAASPQGAPLGPEFRVNTSTVGVQARPSVAADPSGNFVVVWMSAEDGSGSGIFGQRYAASGAPLGPQFPINTYTTGNQGFPLVASDSAGNFVVVWMSRDQDGSDYGIFGRRFASSGTPLGSEFRVNTYTTGYQLFPSLSADPSGNFVVAWNGNDGEQGGIFAQRYAGSGAPLGPEFLVNTYTTGSQVRPSVAVSGTGDFVIAWASAVASSPLNIIGQRYASSGTPVGSEFRVNTDTTDSHFMPSVAADASGNFVVAWTSEEQDGSAYGIFGQRFASSGAAVGPEFRVNTYTASDQATPSVVTDAAGNFVVVWSSFLQDGSFWGVFGQRYAASGTPLGPEFRVNTYTTLDQAHPSVTADSAGNFVVVWDSENQDGSSYGVFGQRYGQIVPVELMRFTVE